MCFYIEKDKFSKMFKNCTYSLNRSFPTANNMSLEILQNVIHFPKYLC